jgi:competence protein ComEC
VSRVDAGPLCALTALIAGILAGAHAPPTTAGLVAGVALLALACCLDGGARLAVAICGFALLGIAVTARADDGLRHPNLTGTATVDAVLQADPSSSRFGASALARATLAHGAHRTLLVTAQGDDAIRLRVLAAGDNVTIAGRFAPLRPSGFDAAARVRHAAARFEDTRLIALRAPGRFLAVANRLRDTVLRGTRPLPGAQRALLSGFLLGDTRGIPDATVTAYRDSGLSHLLAVSGENVAFVLALAGPLLRRLPLLGRTALAAAVIVVFAAMTRFEPSVLRACAMAAIALLATLLGRPASRVRVLAAAVIVLLLADPFLLRSVGFLLSCGASAGIAFLEPPIARRLRGPRVLVEPLAVSLAAQAGVMPVLLVAFGRFPLVTPLTNLAAAPAAGLLGVYGFVASVVAGVVPAAGPLLHQPTSLLIRWITAVAQAGATVPLEIDGRAALGLVTAAAGIASVACLRVRRPVSEPASG